MRCLNEAAMPFVRTKFSCFFFFGFTITIFFWVCLSFVLLLGGMLH
jgi:hypothetical protein